MIWKIVDFIISLKLYRVLKVVNGVDNTICAANWSLCLWNAAKLERQ